jgi:undecaprenyl diphosphate synthase
VHTLKKEVDSLERNGVRLRFIGDRDALSDNLRSLIEESEQQTRANTQLDLVIAANYGGQWDITRAFKILVGRIQSGELQAEDITADVIADELSISDLPLPDLFIRTGGEQRISNFLLWQLAYTELYFTEILWPAFDERQLDEALSWYASRQRRFGRTGDQVEQLKGA